MSSLLNEGVVESEQLEHQDSIIDVKVMKCNSDSEARVNPISSIAQQIKDGEKIEEKVKTLFDQYGEEGFGYEPKSKEEGTAPDMEECTQGCGLCVKKADMDYHCFVQCKKFAVECKVCEFQAFLNDPKAPSFADHDCVQTLKQKLKEANDEIFQLQAGFGMRRQPAQRVQQERQVE